MSVEPRIRAAARLAMLTACVVAAPAHARGQVATAPIEIATPRQAALSHTPDGWRLIQEVHVSNLVDEPFDLLALDVLDSALATPLRHYDGALLLANMRKPQQPDSLRAVRLQPGQRVMVHVNVAADPARLPAALRYRATVSSVGRERNAVLTLQTAALPLMPVQPVTLGPPLRSGPWAVFLGPDTMRTDPHNRLLVGVNARILSPQRFAIDLVKFGPDGRTWHGVIGRLENWPGFGEEIVAVADGVVIEAADSLPDQTPPEYRRGPANRVVLDIGGGRYAVYVHLRRGSLRVRSGARVRRGDVLAQVGNSGNSTGPHLHFHLLDAPSSIAGEGVPFVFDRYQQVGVLAQPADAYDEGAVWRADRSVPRRALLPNNGDVLRF